MAEWLFLPLCMRNLETSLHLFVDCPHSHRIWARAAALAVAPSLDPASWTVQQRAVDWLASLSLGLPSAEASRVRSWSLLVLWHIWLERNARTFREVSSSVEATLAKIADEAAAWDLAGAKIATPRELSVLVFFSCWAGLWLNLLSRVCSRLHGCTLKPSSINISNSSSAEFS